MFELNNAVKSDWNRVVEGKNGWRFIGEGSNNCLSQLIGKINPPQEVMNEWVAACKSRKAFLGEGSDLIIVPEKAVIYRDYLPDGIEIDLTRFPFWLHSQQHALYLFMDALPAGHGVMEGKDTYLRWDSHISPFGAYVASLTILARLSLPLNAFAPEWSEAVCLNNDLASEDEKTPIMMPQLANGAHLKVKWNGILNRGAVKVIENDKALIRKKVMIFGDSHSSWFIAPLLAQHVHEVFFVHSTSVDLSIVETVSPDYVVTQIAERFMMQSPGEGRSIDSIMREKYVSGLLSPAEKKNFVLSFDDLSSVYDRSMQVLYKQLRHEVDQAYE